MVRSSQRKPKKPNGKVAKGLKIEDVDRMKIEFCHFFPDSRPDLQTPTSEMEDYQAERELLWACQDQTKSQQKRLKRE